VFFCTWFSVVDEVLDSPFFSIRLTGAFYLVVIVAVVDGEETRGTRFLPVCSHYISDKS